MKGRQAWRRRQVTVYLDPDMLQAINDLAELYIERPSQMIRILLGEAIKVHKDRLGDLLGVWHHVFNDKGD